MPPHGTEADGSSPAAAAAGHAAGAATAAAFYAVRLAELPDEVMFITACQGTLVELLMLDGVWIWGSRKI